MDAARIQQPGYVVRLHHIASLGWSPGVFPAQTGRKFNIIDYIITMAVVFDGCPLAIDE
jgi:hypothetical protein